MLSAMRARSGASLMWYGRIMSRDVVIIGSGGNGTVGQSGAPSWGFDGSGRSNSFCMVMEWGLLLGCKEEIYVVREIWCRLDMRYQSLGVLYFKSEISTSLSETS